MAALPPLRASDPWSPKSYPIILDGMVGHEHLLSGIAAPGAPVLHELIEIWNRVETIWPSHGWPYETAATRAGTQIEVAYRPGGDVLARTLLACEIWHRDHGRGAKYIPDDGCAVQRASVTDEGCRKIVEFVAAGSPAVAFRERESQCNEL